MLFFPHASSANSISDNRAPNSDVDTPTNRDKFWAFVTVFGTLWGGLELTLGTFLHVLRVPKTGLIMVALSLILLLAQRKIFPARGSTLCAGIIAACIKSLSPGGIIAGPIFGILSEALIVEMCLLIGSSQTMLCMWAGACALVWSQVQSLFKMWIYYGADFITALARILEKFFKVEWTASIGWTLVAIFFLIVSGIGATAGFIGARLGLRVKTDLSIAPKRCPSPLDMPEGHSFECSTAMEPQSNTSLSNRQTLCTPLNPPEEAVPFPSQKPHKKIPIDNERIARKRLFVLPFAIGTLVAQFGGHLIASCIALAVWLIALAIFSRGVLRAIWWPKFWGFTLVLSVACGVVIAWNMEGTWHIQLGVEASLRMMVRGTYVFSLVSWITRCLRPKECLTFWNKLGMPKLGLSITRAFALLPTWNDKLHAVVQNRPSNLRDLWKYMHHNIVQCLIEASLQTETIQMQKNSTK